MSGLHLKGRHRPVPKVSSWPLRADDINTEVRRNHLLGTSVESTDAESSPSRAPWQHGGDLLPVAAASSSFSSRQKYTNPKIEDPIPGTSRKTQNFKPKKKKRTTFEKKSSPLFSWPQLEISASRPPWESVEPSPPSPPAEASRPPRNPPRQGSWVTEVLGGVPREVLYSKHSVEGSIKGT